ncbi:MAG: hypothetical protein IPM77_18010 [Crocinitomicaceae bacterium]|nr:hypothetical protein [Crocinitomicaceae bacterium]
MPQKLHNNYRRIQLLIGTLGMSLPFLLVLFQMIMTKINHKNYPAFLPSISHYNYSYAQIIFVGTLASFGLLLISYKGYLKDDHKIKDVTITNIAGLLALIVALIPTDFDEHAIFNTPNKHTSSILASIHLISAGLFLILLGLMSVYKFTLSPKDDSWHQRRKKWYRIFGWTVILSISVLIFLFAYGFFSDEEVNMGYWVYIFETTSLVAFGFSWLLKGKSAIFVPLGLVSKEELDEARSVN